MEAGCLLAIDDGADGFGLPVKKCEELEAREGFGNSIREPTMSLRLYYL